MNIPTVQPVSKPENKKAVFEAKEVTNTFKAACSAQWNKNFEAYKKAQLNK